MEQQIKRMKSIISSMDEKNIFCIDCGIDKIDYVSINNGIINVQNVMKNIKISDIKFRI